MTAAHVRPCPLQSLSYASPQALLNALLPQAQLPAAAAEADGGRVAAFKRYIAGAWLTELLLLPACGTAPAPAPPLQTS